MSARHAPLTELDPHRICLIKPSALGDIVQSLPVLSALRARWPEAHIAWVVKESLANVLDRNPDLDDVIAYQDNVWPRWSALGRLGRCLWKMEFDLSIDLQGLGRSGVMSLSTAAKRRVGFANARECAVLAYTDRVPVPTLEMPTVERYWLVARAFGAPPRPKPPQIHLIPYLRRWAEKQLQALPRPLLALHPGTSWQTKRIPPQHYARIAERAWREFSAAVVLFGGRDEVPLCQAIDSQLNGPRLNLSGQTTIQQLAAISAEVDVFLAGDTGPMHVAAAAGAPVVAMFTCTSPLRAQPYGENHRLVQTAVPCAGSYLRKCSSLACMDELTPARIWPSVAGQLEQAMRRRIAA